MRVVARVDQLRGYAHAVACALNASLHHVRYTELLTDVAQVPRRAGLVLHHTGAADYFQVRDLGEVGQNLVLHAIGKESVVLIAA